MANVNYRMNWHRAMVCLLVGLFSASLSLANERSKNVLLLRADRVFDGYTLHQKSSVLIVDGLVVEVAKQGTVNAEFAQVLELGDATLLPGLIEMHAHLGYRNVPGDVVLKHGITTLRDLGGPAHKPYGGDGRLRVLTSGPILTAVGGYPVPVLGSKDIAIEISDERQARQAVRDLIDQGAVIIKIALEPGGESGAPWSKHHGHAAHAKAKTGAYQQHSGHKQQMHHGSWPMLSEALVKAIVDEAHRHGHQVSAHIGEAQGAEIALKAGVDEWSHMPCDNIPQALLAKAVKQKIRIITTLDTLSNCKGVMTNAQILGSIGADLIYGAEIAHSDIPWGIDARELMLMRYKASMSIRDVLHAATAKAGKALGNPLLGTMISGAPADVIAVKGNALERIKLLEYPDLVISGGNIVVNAFE